MTFLVIILLTLIPGFGIAALLPRHSDSLISWLSVASALGLVWSVFSTFAITIVGGPLSLPFLLITGLLPLVITLVHPKTRGVLVSDLRNIRWQPTNLAVFIFVSIFLLLPFLTVHKQLPTGDVQKAIYWANQITDSNRLPEYKKAEQLNRDPSDFLTPGLHTITAAVIKVSNSPLQSVAWFSFFLSIVLAGLSVTITSFITENSKAQLLAFVFAGLNLRFLRYAFFPGYHFQNLVGEIILFTALITFLFSIRHNSTLKINVLLGMTGFCLLSLPLVHQFTSFLALFVSLSAAGTFLVVKRKQLTGKTQKKLLLVLIACAMAVAVIAIFVPVINKLTALFTLSPHLTPFIIPLTKYPETFGITLFFFGIFGMVLAIKKKRTSLPVLVISAVTLTILFLGQGPYFFVDIPSARTIFFAALPLAVFCAVFLDNLTTVIGDTLKYGKYFATILLTVIFASLANSAALQAENIDHQSRVNASLTEDTLGMINFLRSNPPKEFKNFLIDDWNRRRLTWAILSPYNMVTRIGGDLRVIGDEAKQSDLRKKLYESSLDYEKIFMLGNSPLVKRLLDKYQIALVGSSIGSTGDVFQTSPLFKKTYSNGETVIYAYKTSSQFIPDPEAEFLLKHSTLANDVGDSEDILPHTAISLAAARISDPEIENNRTTRTIQGTDGTIRINVGTYVLPLWDEDGNTKVESPVRILIRIKNNGVEGSFSYNNKELTDFETPKDNGSTDIVVDMPAGSLSYDEKGFININMNFKKYPLTIDLVAAGLMR